MLCPKCHADVPDEATTCQSCGADLTGSHSQKSRCPKCGAEVDNTAAFCPACGNSMKEQADSVPKNKCKEPSKKRRMVRIIILVVAGLIFLCSGSARTIMAVAALFVGIPASVIAVIVCAIRKKPKKRWCIAFAVALFMVVFYGVMPLPCSHEWQDATCTEPKTCVKCERTQGEALGHEWIEASCAEPKTCSRCGKTEGEALGHSWGEWTVIRDATPTTAGEKVKVCSICGAESRVKFELEVLHENGYCLLSPKELGERLADKFIFQKATMLYDLNGMRCAMTGVAMTGEYSKYSRYTDGEAVAVIFFFSTDSVLGISDKDSKHVHMLATKFFTTDGDKIADTMIGIIQTVDPKQDDSGARSVGKKIIDALQNGDMTYSENDIVYGLTRLNGTYTFMVSFGNGE